MTRDQEAAPATRHQRLAAAAVWLGAISVLVLLRYRGRIWIFDSLHRWLAEQGAADWVRQMDNEVLLILAGVGLWMLMRRTGRGRAQGLLSDLGMDQGMVRGCLLGLVICSPMLVLGAVCGRGASFDWHMIRVAVVGPLAEEWFFRGVLVLCFARLVGSRFWPTAVVSALLFGLAHVPWTRGGLAGGWQIILVTGGGGVWYAWLARQWSRNLFVVITAHGLMNLAWPWYGGSSGAVGSTILAEIGRGATIALGTVLTARPEWFRMGWARLRHESLEKGSVR
jgi:membrane protease YdiL (CAAX protease family)